MTGPPVPPAFAEFYDDRLQQTVRQVALMVGSVQVAEDVTHDAMIEVFKRWDQLENPGGYLYRCASNGALTWLNRRRGDVAAVVEEAVAPSHEFVEVAEMLNRLTDRQRVAVVLHYYGDLTESQIATAMQCRRGSVGPLLTRARAALREEMAR